MCISEKSIFINKIAKYFKFKNIKKIIHLYEINKLVLNLKKYVYLFYTIYKL